MKSARRLAQAGWAKCIPRDTQLGRDVAIKVIALSFAIDKDRLRRFEQEACAAGALNHPNVLIVRSSFASY
jgi:hypothetical protein